MPSGERAYDNSQERSVWRKSTAMKVGAGMVVAGAFFGLSFAAIGLGIMTGAWYWHKRAK